MQFLPPPSLQTETHAIAAVSRFTDIPKEELTAQEDLQVPGTFSVYKNDLSADPDIWWYGLNAEVTQFPTDNAIPARDFLVNALTRIEELTGQQRSAMTVRPDRLARGAFFATSESDGDTVDHWIGPEGEVIPEARRNARPRPELERAQIAAITAPVRAEALARQAAEPGRYL